MVKKNKLEVANMNYGNCCISVYDSCRNRKTPVALAEQLLTSVTRTGGLVEDIIVCGDDGVKRREALDEINRARYTAKLLFENNCCKDRVIRRFMATADCLADALLNPEPVKERKKVDKKPVKKPEKAPKVKKVVNYDPDGFDDVYEEPQSDKN